MKKIVLTLLLGAITLTGFAQDKVYQIDEVTVINYGDGRMLFRQADADKAPLNGSHRLIDGYHSEYILAGFKDGMYHGKYQHFKNNVLKEEATYNEGNLEGVRTCYYADGQTIQSQSSFTAGKLDGVHKTFYQNGAVEIEKGYKMGAQDGVEHRYDKEGTQLTDCLYKDGKPEGKWTEYVYSNRGDFTRVSHYKNGRKEGEWTDTWKDGTLRSKSVYKDGKKNGVCVDYRRSGEPECSTTYKDDKKNGEEILYFTDGTVEKSIPYVADKWNGVVREFYNGSGKPKMESTYKDGKREGDYKRFYDTGVLREEGRCEYGTEVYRKEYHANGKLKAVAERRSGSWETLERYDSEGKKL